MKVKRLSSIFFAVVLTLSIWTVCYADTAYGDYMEATGTLTIVTSTRARMATMGYVYTPFAPADQAQAIATLYKGGLYVDSANTGVDFSPINPFGIDIDASSSQTGSWQGIGWNWVAWPGEGIEESLSTYDPSLLIEMSEIQAHQAAVMVNLGEYSSWHCFNEVTSPQVKDVIHDKSAVRLDVAFHTKVIPTHIEVGDRIPLLLVSPSAEKAVAVFVKASGNIVCVPLQKDGVEWLVGRSFIIDNTTEVE